MRIRVITALLIAVATAACGSFVPTVRLDKLPPEQKSQVQSIRIYNSTQLVGKDFEVLNVVEGNSCQNQMWDPPATRSAAIEQAKFYAWEVGANAITNIQCGGREGTSVRTNCWELISCTAEAIRITE